MFASSSLKITRKKGVVKKDREKQEEERKDELELRRENTIVHTMMNKKFSSIAQHLPCAVVLDDFTMRCCGSKKTCTQCYRLSSSKRCNSSSSAVDFLFNHKADENHSCRHSIGIKSPDTYLDTLKDEVVTEVGAIDVDDECMVQPMAKILLDEDLFIVVDEHLLSCMVIADNKKVFIESSCCVGPDLHVVSGNDLPMTPWINVGFIGDEILQIEGIERCRQVASGP